MGVKYISILDEINYLVEWIDAISYNHPTNHVRVILNKNLQEMFIYDLDLLIFDISILLKNVLFDKIKLITTPDSTESEDMGFEEFKNILNSVSRRIIIDNLTL